MGGGQWLTDGELDEFRSLGVRRRFPARTTLYVEGDDPYDVMLIESGTVKITTMSLAGHEVVLDMMSAGRLLGELAALDQGRRAVTAVALTPVEVTSVAVDQFLGFLSDNVAATHALLRLTVTRLREAYRRELEYARLDALGRVCARLNDLARWSASSSSGAPPSESPYSSDDVQITLMLTQTELAQWCGLSREAVVKSLRKLRDDGWITTCHGTITIVEPERVRERGSI